MPTTFSPEIQKFITEELKTGKYENESALLTEALTVFQELTRRHTELRAQIQQSLEDEKAGRVSSLDIGDMIKELETELDKSGQPRS